MSKIAMMVSRDSLDAPLAGTFGKAKWLLLVDGTASAFRRNRSLSGGSVAAAIAASGCEDVIAAHVGARACAHLRSLGLRLWRGPADTPVRRVIEMHRRGELAPWPDDGDLESGGCTASPRGARRHAAHEHGEPAALPIVQLRRK